MGRPLEGSARRLGPEVEGLVPPCALTIHNGALCSLAAGRPGSVNGPLYVPDSDVHAAEFFDALTGR